MLALVAGKRSKKRTNLIRLIEQSLKRNSVAEMKKKSLMVTKGLMLLIASKAKSNL